MRHATGRGRHVRALGAVVLTSSLLATAACGSSGEDGSTTTSVAGQPVTTDEPVGSSDATTSSTAEGSSSSSSPTTSAASSTTLPDASDDPHSAPGDGTGTALLRDVRIGRNVGFERIVFEFEGTSMPGYRIQWVDGPITADASGEVVEVAGDAYLQIVLDPASGVDLSGDEFEVVYDGPDRIDTTGQTELLVDLVRTGDFEAVLSWAAGTTGRVPFRVLTLTGPTRVVVDLATS